MFVQIKCSFCDQAFDFDSSSGILLADCPHCGKQNTVVASSGAAKELNIQRDAPNLSGAKPCPSCKTQVARDAVLCIHCGYHFATGKKVGGGSWFAANQRLVLLAGGGLVAMAVAAAYLLWPEPAIPPPVVSAAVEPVGVPSPPAQPEPAAPAVAAAATNLPAEPVAPPPPPGPTPEELAAQQAEAERAARTAQAEAERVAFAAKKVQAEQNLRQQLNAREPLYQINGTVELRRNNGVVDKGTLTSFAGTGTGRVALVATALGEVGVPLVSLDNASRRRVDPDYREAFIQHLLSTKLPDPGAKPEE